jgi:hypothetical protein
LIDRAGELASLQAFIKHVWVDIHVKEGSLRAHLTAFREFSAWASRAHAMSPISPAAAIASSRPSSAARRPTPVARRIPR